MSENRIQKYLRAIAQQIQPVEEGLSQFIAGFDVATAVGAQLDLLGKRVGQARGSLDDSSYRRFLRARISANKSNGTVEDILGVVGGVVGDPGAVFRLEQQPPAAFALRIDDIAVDEDLADITASFLRSTASAGVRAVLAYSPSAPSEVLIMTLSTDLGLGQLTLGISTDPDEGGDLSRARV